MRNTVLFIAMSLDGYIADQSGKVDWLTGQNAGKDDMETYNQFIQTVDTVVMGWKTYHQIISELSPSQWVYPNLTSYVITHHESPSSNIVQFTQQAPGSLIRKLKQQAGKDIWICGGADIAGQLIQENLIDRYHISVIPTLLGRGIRLFGRTDQEIKLKLLKTQSYNGITDLIYERR